MYGLEKYQFVEGSILMYFFWLPKFLQFLHLTLPPCFTIHVPIRKPVLELENNSQLSET